MKTDQIIKTPELPKLDYAALDLYGIEHELNALIKSNAYMVDAKEVDAWIEAQKKPVQDQCTALIQAHDARPDVIALRERKKALQAELNEITGQLNAAYAPTSEQIKALRAPYDGNEFDKSKLRHENNWRLEALFKQHVIAAFGLEDQSGNILDVAGRAATGRDSDGDVSFDWYDFTESVRMIAEVRYPGGYVTNGPMPPPPAANGGKGPQREDIIDL